MHTLKYTMVCPNTIFTVMYGLLLPDMRLKLLFIFLLIASLLRLWGCVVTFPVALETSAATASSFF